MFTHLHELHYVAASPTPTHDASPSTDQIVPCDNYQTDTLRSRRFTRSKGVFIATRLNWTQLTHLNSVEPSQSCFCLWRHDLQTESTGSLRSLIGDSCSRCERVDNSTSSWVHRWVEFSWVELCRNKRALTYVSDVSRRDTLRQTRVEIISQQNMWLVCCVVDDEQLADVISRWRLHELWAREVGFERVQVKWAPARVKPRFQKFSALT